MRTPRSGGKSRFASLTAATLTVLVVVGVAAWALEALRLRAREVAVAAIGAGLGTPVTIGRLSGDPWRGLVLDKIGLHGVPGIGRPFLAARRATITFDTQRLAGALLRQRGVASSIVRVVLDQPTLTLERDASGAWNVPPFLGRATGATGVPVFSGRIIVHGGVVEFADRRRISPEVFRARFLAVDGFADFARAPRIALRATFEEERGGLRASGRIRGTYAASTRTLDLDVQAAGADAGAWGPYLIAGPGMRITGGRFDGVLHVLWTRTAARSHTDYYGRIALRDGRAVIPSRNAQVVGVRGEIEVQTGRVRSALLEGTLNGLRLQVRGEASLNGEPYLDLALRSAGADVVAVARLLLPHVADRLAGQASGEIRLTGPLRSLLAEGRLQTSRARLGGVVLRNASAEFSLQDRMLNLTSARSEVAGGTVRGSAWWVLGSPEFAFAARLDDTDASAVLRWVPQAPSGLRGRLGGSIAARGHGGDLQFVGRAAVTDAAFGRNALGSVETSFRSDSGGIALEQLHLNRGTVWVIAGGHLRKGGDVALQARAGAADIGQVAEFSAPGGISGCADFTGWVRGSLRQPDLSGTVMVREGRLGGFDFDVARGGVTLGRDGVRLEGVTVRAGRAHLRAAGTLALRPTARLEMNVEVERVPAETLARAVTLPLSVAGPVYGSARIEGPLSRPSAAGTVALREAEVVGQPVDHASASFQWDGTRLIATGGVLRRQDSEVSFSGTYHRRSGLAIDLAARALELGSLNLPSSPAGRPEGRLNALARITGPAKSPAVALSFEATGLALDRARFDHASGDVKWAAGVLQIQPLTLRTGSERYEISGGVRLGSVPGATLSVAFSDARLSTLLGLTGVGPAFPLDGTVSGSAEMDGPLANISARLNLRMTEGRFGSHTLQGGHADLAMSDGVLTVEEFELRPGRGTIAAAGRLNLRGESQIEVSGTDLELDLLRPLLRLRRPMIGRLDFTMQMGGTLDVPEIGAALEITRGGVEGATFDSLVANAYYREGLLQVQQALLVQSGHKLRLSGILPFNPARGRFDERGPLDLRLGLADVNLGLLRLATDAVEEGTGAIEGEVRINGTVGAPVLSGGLRVNDGRLRLRGMQVPVEALRVGLQFDATTVRVAEGTARLGEGTVSLEGSARILGVASARPVVAIPEDAPLLLQASGARIVVHPYVDARASGSVRLWGVMGDPRRPLTMDGLLNVSGGAVSITSAAGPPAALRPHLALRGVRLEAGRDLSVKVGGLKFGIKPGGSLLVAGTLRSPTLEGTVEAQEGAVSALGAVFELREGTATFQPHLGLRPAITARAETQAGATRISLAVRGIAPNGLVLDLHSDPERPRTEILALLANQAGLARLAAGDVEGALRAEIGRMIFGRVSLALGRAIGLSELVIEYDFERPLTLRAGKRLLSGLYLTAQTTFDEHNRWLWALEYRFARFWHFTLRSDSTGHWDAIFWYTARF